MLEKHADFFRDFRGDTVHPSTLDLVDQLGFRDEFEAVPHTRLRTLDAVVGSMRLHPIDFGRLRGQNHEIALMPQWDLLNLLASEGRRYPGFRLVMGAEVTDVVRTAGRVTGVVAQTAEGRAARRVHVHGRRRRPDSTVRDRLRLTAERRGRPSTSCGSGSRPFPRCRTLAYIGASTMVVTHRRARTPPVPRPDPQGDLRGRHGQRAPAFRERIVPSAPPLAEVVDAAQRLGLRSC